MQALPGGGVCETDWAPVMTVRNGKGAGFIGRFDTAAVAKARASIRK